MRVGKRQYATPANEKTQQGKICFMITRSGARLAALVAIAAVFWLPIHQGEAANTLRDAKAHYERAEYPEANAIWEQLAHAGSGAAFYNLAQAYRRGQGVFTNVEAAKGFFAQGGLQKHAESLTGLATLLYFEDKGARSSGEALALFQEAGRAGSAGAQYVLATLHYNGKGVPQDSQLAYAWAHLSAQKGFGDARTVEARAEALLSEHQLSQAKIIMNTLEGPVDFAGLQSILRKWARQAPQLAPRAAVIPAQPARRAAAAPVANSVQNNWRLQVGAFRSIGGAQLQLEKLTAGTEDILKGLKWSLLQTRRPGRDDVLYKLQIGPFQSRAAAREKCEQIKPLRLDCFVVAP
jgi:TPR repeat protein